ncbi:hypothetical protein GOC91_03360 [Sinorhizobium medicae]|nr:hypothetical protein [Sinorhizobium medicae]MDX0625270.1 hypothetical protein [Sinorhizobium medicae]MDX0877939.1 hypothetical protein [Sinorhizobium medicae]MDX1224641.1 hypothetical protein [Sinorhizobium medicae]
MGRALLFVTAAAAVAIVAYGYLDAGSEKRVTADIRMRVIRQDSLHFDTFQLFQPFPRGQLFVRLQWSQPEGMRISRLRLNGRLMDRDRELEAFDDQCGRADSQWLADAEWEWNTFKYTDLVCFIKLKTALPVESDLNGQLSLASVDALNQRVSNLSIADGQYTAWAVRPKMRYIAWIDDMIEKATAYIRYPFERD